MPVNETFETDSKLDDRVRSLVYDAFITDGVAPRRARLASQLALPEAQVAASFERLAKAHVLVLQPHSCEILMANPFSAVPTLYRVRSEDRAWWGNCIWDALGIIAMTGGDGLVESSCPDCGEGLTLHVRSGQLLPAEAIAHFAVPAAHWWDDIVFT